MKKGKRVFFSPLKRSKLTRIIYVLYIAIVLFICMILLTPRIVGLFQRIFCRTFNKNFCEVLIGYDAVYRIGFALAVWFFVLSLLTLGISSSIDERAPIQNGCWLLKTTGLIILAVIFVYIPHSEYNGEIWLFFGLNAAFCFIILQYAFILDASNYLCVVYEEIIKNKSFPYSSYIMASFEAAKTVTTIFLFIVSLTSCIVFYFIYASFNRCFHNFVFLTFHLIMCIASSLISTLPVVRDANPHIGLFQCSVTSLYCTYVMWLAFSSEPNARCNPSSPINIPHHLFRDFTHAQFCEVEPAIQDSVTRDKSNVSNGMEDTQVHDGTAAIISKQLTRTSNVVCNGYSEICEDKKKANLFLENQKYCCFCSSSQFTKSPNERSPVESEEGLAWDDTFLSSDASHKEENFASNLFHSSPIELNIAENKHFTHAQRKSGDYETCCSQQMNTFETPASGLITILNDEIDGTEYSYSFIHLTFTLATLYLVMSITNWYRLDEGQYLTVRLVRSWSTVWLRISASIFCSFILIWSMVVPLMFPNTYQDLLFFQYLTSLPP
ncbi:serine incorporator 2-like [Xenia sp. Carnegie-2017]|uniref:serine incorporator 2-like n=1 Tax=Xenia sp. Carnegie-2017 TaxID=2897299 RepID=UPI001F049495|nr:serine incorporator 2-like [Xenia sp. Carnegie-2017]